MERKEETPGWIIFAIFVIGFAIGFWVAKEKYTPSDEEISHSIDQQECISAFLEKMESATNDLVYNVDGTYQEQKEAMENAIHSLRNNLVGCQE